MIVLAFVRLLFHRDYLAPSQILFKLLVFVLGTQEQCKKTLEHLERIITVKADILRKENPKRKEPKCVFSYSFYQTSELFYMSFKFGH